MIDDLEKVELEKIEKAVDSLLDELAKSGDDAPDCALADLENYAERAAKIAFGSGHPELISYQMHYLISWTDHLDEDFMVKGFRKALRNRPLVSPW